MIMSLPHSRPTPKCARRAWRARRAKNQDVFSVAVPTSLLGDLPWRAWFRESGYYIVHTCSPGTSATERQFWWLPRA